MKRRHMLFTALAALCGTLPCIHAKAQDVSFARTMSQPGVHAIMRHALAPGGGDPAEFVLGDCATQRNLDQQGRRQARVIGEALRDAGANFDAVLTSQWCRCVDTARLLDIGPVQALPALNSFFGDRSATGEQTRELRDHLAGLPPGEKVMLVTHQVNITALLNVFPSSGEVFLFRMDPDGTVRVLDNLEIDP